MTSVDAVLNQLIDLNEIDWKELVPGVMGKRVWSDPVSYTHLTLPTICSV